MNLYVGQRILYRGDMVKIDMTGIISSITENEVCFWTDRDNDLRCVDVNGITPLPDMNFYIGQRILFSSDLGFECTGIITKILRDKIYFDSDNKNEGIHYGYISEITPLEEKIPYNKLFPNVTHEDVFEILKPFNQTGGNYGTTVTFYDRNSGHINFKIDGGEEWEVEFDSLSEAMGKAQEIINELNPEFQKVWNDWNTKDEKN